MSNNGNSAGSVLVAFALGAVAGAAVALLYAPASGEETRRKLAEKAREGRDKAEELAREGREFLDRQRDDIDVGGRARPRGVRAGAEGDPVSDWQSSCGWPSWPWRCVVMAAIQIGLALIVAARRQADEATTDALRREVKPLIEKANRLVDEASRVTSLAAAQVERVERLLASTSERVDETLGRPAGRDPAARPAGRGADDGDSRRAVGDPRSQARARAAGPRRRRRTVRRLDAVARLV